MPGLVSKTAVSIPTTELNVGQSILLDWDKFWLQWKPDSNEPPPYWGPPPSDEEVSKAKSWGIPPQPTMESCPITQSMKKTVRDLLSLKIKVGTQLRCMSVAYMSANR
jgi:hypothetical protein